MKYAGIVLILLVALNIYGVIFNNSEIPASNNKRSGKTPEMDEFNDEDDDLVDDNPIIDDSPKTASPVELEQEYDFSFNTTIEDTWTYSYSHRTQGQWLHQPEPKGYDVSFQLNITNLRNSTNDLVDKAWFAGITVIFWNDPTNCFENLYFAW